MGVRGGCPDQSQCLDRLKAKSFRAFYFPSRILPNPSESFRSFRVRIREGGLPIPYPSHGPQVLSGESVTNEFDIFAFYTAWFFLGSKFHYFEIGDCHGMMPFVFSLSRPRTVRCFTRSLTVICFLKIATHISKLVIDVLARSEHHPLESEPVQVRSDQNFNQNCPQSMQGSLPRPAQHKQDENSSPRFSCTAAPKRLD